MTDAQPPDVDEHDDGQPRLSADEVEPVDVDRRLSDRPVPTLHAEMRVRVESDSGSWNVPVTDEDDAYTVGQSVAPRTWRIERRMVSPWAEVTPRMRTVIAVEVIDDSTTAAPSTPEDVGDDHGAVANGRRD